MGQHFPNDDFSYLLSDKGELFLKYLFDKYYSDLCKLSFKYVGRADIAEDLVQEVFINVWNKRNDLKFEGNIRPCLTTSVINTSINYIKSKFARQLMEDESSIQNSAAFDDPHAEMVSQELDDLLKQAIEQLPDRCRTIFSLSRFSGLTYKEIADQLNLSVKTVEAQMSIALKRIHDFLLKYGYLLLFIFSSK